MLALRNHAGGPTARMSLAMVLEKLQAKDGQLNSLPGENERRVGISSLLAQLEKGRRPKAKTNKFYIQYIQEACDQAIHKEEKGDARSQLRPTLFAEIMKQHFKVDGRLPIDFT